MKKNLRLSLLFTIFISILSICFSRFSYAANESYSTWNGLTTSVINDPSIKHIIFTIFFDRNRCKNLQESKRKLIFAPILII